MNSVQFKDINAKEAIKTFKLKEKLESIGIDNFSESELNDLKVRVYAGDGFIDGDLDLTDLFQEEDVIGVYVVGDLKVTGSIIDWEPDAISAFLVVGGRLETKNLINGCGGVFVGKDMNIDCAYFGYYNHGYTEVEGNLSAEYIIIDDHSVECKGTINGFLVGDGLDNAKSQYRLSEILTEDLVNSIDEEGDTTPLIRALVNGINCFSVMQSNK